MECAYLYLHESHGFQLFEYYTLAAELCGFPKLEQWSITVQDYISSVPLERSYYIPLQEGENIKETEQKSLTKSEVQDLTENSWQGQNLRLIPKQAILFPTSLLIPKEQRMIDVFVSLLEGLSLTF